jgi:hypothetical protein
LEQAVSGSALEGASETIHKIGLKSGSTGLFDEDEVAMRGEGHSWSDRIH